MVEISSAIKYDLYLKFKGRCDGQFKLKRRQTGTTMKWKPFK